MTNYTSLKHQNDFEAEIAATCSFKTNLMRGISVLKNCFLFCNIYHDQKKKEKKKALWKCFSHSHFIALDISKSDFQCLVACGQITAIICLQIGSSTQPHYLGFWRHSVRWCFLLVSYLFPAPFSTKAFSPNVTHHPSSEMT